MCRIRRKKSSKVCFLPSQRLWVSIPKAWIRFKLLTSLNESPAAMSAGSWKIVAQLPNVPSKLVMLASLIINWRYGFYCHFAIDVHSVHSTMFCGSVAEPTRWGKGHSRPLFSGHSPANSGAANPIIWISPAGRLVLVANRSNTVAFPSGPVLT